MKTKIEKECKCNAEDCYSDEWQKIVCKCPCHQQEECKHEWKYYEEVDKEICELCRMVKPIGTLDQLRAENRTPQQETEWEKEFDKIRNDGEHCSIDDEALNKFDVIMLKDIIRQLLAEQRESIVKELEEGLDKVIKATESDIEFAQKHRYVCQTKGRQEVLVLKSKLQNL